MELVRDRVGGATRTVGSRLVERKTNHREVRSDALPLLSREKLRDL